MCPQPIAENRDKKERKWIMPRTATQKAEKPQQAGGLRRFNPTAELPIPSVLKRFTEEEVQLLERLTTEMAECVYHPSFRRSAVPGEDEDVGIEELRFHPEDPDVLTAAQERVLFMQFNYCRHRVMRVLRNHRSKRLTAAASRELVHWGQRAQEIRENIVQANTSLVLAMARRAKNNSIEIGELISEGNLALLRCVDKFDASRGFKFSTYACRAILASFSRAGAKSARYRTQFPTPYDPAMERSDYLETQRDEVELECVDELKRILFDNTAQLSAVERRVLNARFSLDKKSTRPTRRKTLDQVGSQLGVSKERVRQIQNQAMIKLRAVLEERLLAAS